MKDMSNSELMKELERRLFLHEKIIQEQEIMLAQMKDLNRKLELSEALKSHFISNIKNEINNPLASILAMTQNMLSKENFSIVDIHQSIRLIYNEAHALDFQLDNIMTAAELEAGGTTPELVNANINQIIEGVVNSFSSQISRKKLKLKVNGNKEIHFVTDRHYFKIIVANLISNAIKFSKDEGYIEISLKDSFDKLTVAVADEGKKIQRDDVSKIFDRFTQLDSGTVKKFLGHGLGLSVTRELLELMGGHIEVTSASNGNIFTISLPIRKSDESISTALGDGTEVFFDNAF